MDPRLMTTTGTIQQRYGELLDAGFTGEEAATLIALADGISRHAEGDEPAPTTWRWQEICRVEFLAHLAETGRLGGRDDGQPGSAARVRDR